MMIIDDWIEDRFEERRFAALPAGEEHGVCLGRKPMQRDTA